MNDSHELATIDLGAILNAKGIVATRKGLVHDYQIPDLDTDGIMAALSEVSKAISRLEQCNQAMPWCLGDGYNLLVQLRVALAAKESGRAIKPERAEQMEIETLGSYADMTNQSRDDVVNTQRTMAFFPYAVRHESLSFDHHKEAFAHADGDLLKANGWLELAEQKQWTVAQMRAFIRKDLAREGAIDAETSKGDDTYDDVDPKVEEIALWASKRVREVPKLDADRCSAMLDALSPLWELEAKLRLACGKAARSGSSPKV